MESPNKAAFEAGCHKTHEFYDTLCLLLFSLRSFHAHAARILEMQVMQSKSHNVIVTSSVDKTVKIWDVSRLLEVVPDVDKLDMKIEKVGECLCFTLGYQITTTNNPLS